ncbi:MAG: hypothetical protein QNJ54_27725 [Prochloraceae cyanobacterium]|nr:hypothetical protein [Prochloraceae cyanobacterium]
MNYAVITKKNFVQIKLFSRKISTFQLVKFIPSWNISPEGSSDPYQSDLYQGYCDYVGAYYQELPVSSRAGYLVRLKKYSKIPQYLNGCFLALKDWS